MSKAKFLFVLSVPVLCFLFLFCIQLRAAVVILKDGETVVGTIVSRNENRVRVQTRDGIRTIKTEAIHKLQTDGKLHEEYRGRKKKIEGRDADAHFRLAIWCRSVGLFEEWKDELETTIAIDPGHHPARIALGYKKKNGVWVHKNQHSREQSKSTPDPLTEAERSKIKSWFQGYLSADTKEKKKEYLERIRSQPASKIRSFLIKYTRSANRSLREFCLRELKNVSDSSVVPVFVKSAVVDPDPDLRNLAWQELKKRDPNKVKPFLVQNLDFKSPTVRIRIALFTKALRIKEAVPVLLQQFYESMTRTHSSGTQRKIVPGPLKEVVKGEDEPYQFKEGGLDYPGMDKGVVTGSDGSEEGNMEGASNNNERPSTNPELADYGLGVDIWRLPVRIKNVPQVIRELERRVLLDALHEITGITFGYNINLWYWWWNKTGKQMYGKMPESKMKSNRSGKQPSNDHPDQKTR